MYAGDFAAFCERHKKKMYSVAYRYLDDVQAAEEATQEALVRIFHASPRLSFHSVYEEQVYALRAARCAALDLSEKMKKSSAVLVDIDTIPEPGTEDDLAFSRVVADGMYEEVELVLGRLSPKARAIFRYHMMGLSDKEIAATLSIGVSDVRTTLHRTRAKLRRQLLEEGYCESV